MVRSLFSNKQEDNSHIWDSLETELQFVVSEMRNEGVGLDKDLFTLDQENNRIVFHLLKDDQEFDLPMNVTTGISLMGKCPVLTPLDDRSNNFKLALELDSIIPDYPDHVTQEQKFLFQYLARRIEEYKPGLQVAEPSIT